MSSYYILSSSCVCKHGFRLLLCPCLLAWEAASSVEVAMVILFRRIASCRWLCFFSNALASFCSNASVSARSVVGVLVLCSLLLCPCLPAWEAASSVEVAMVIYFRRGRPHANIPNVLSRRCALGMQIVDGLSERTAGLWSVSSISL